jgi:hypothetical protein
VIWEDIGMSASAIPVDIAANIASIPFLIARPREIQRIWVIHAMVSMTLLPEVDGEAIGAGIGCEKTLASPSPQSFYMWEK